MSLTKSVFGTFPCGKTADAYTLKNASGVTLVLTNYGCRILQLLTPDKSGKLGDVVLGHATLEEYLGSDFQGTFVGRYANRIGGATLTIDGVHMHSIKTTVQTRCTAAQRATIKYCLM